MEASSREAAKQVDEGAEESRRLATLKALGLPDSARGHPVLQSICDSIAELLSVSTTIISVTGSEYVEFLVKHGTPLQRVPKNESLFSYMATDRRLQAIVAEDIAKDNRLREFPWAKEPSYRCYASFPLMASNGHCLGLLTVVNSTISRRPAEDYNMVCSFAELAARELENSRYGRLEGLMGGRVTTMLRDPQEVEQPVFLCEVVSRWWRVCFANTAARKLTPLLDTPEPHFWGMFQPVDGAKNFAQKLAHAEIAQGNSFTLQVKLRDRSKAEPLTICFRSTYGSPISTPGTTVGIPNEVLTADQLSCSIKHTHYFATLGGRTTQQPEQALLGRAQTFLSREIRTSSHSGRLQSDTSKGMSNVKLGIICSSSQTARVYRAVWNKQVVSVKVIAKRLDHCVQSKDYGSAMIPKEAAFSAELSHPNIVRTYKIVVQPKIAEAAALDYKKGDEVVEASIVREWCASGDMQAVSLRGLLLCEEQEVPDTRLVLSIAAGIAAGMEYLHAHNIVHGGLHPTGILMGDDPHPHQRSYVAKISSFSRADVSVKPTQAAHPPLDPAYAAPELLTKGLLSKASDVYAFGKLLCFMHGTGDIQTAIVEGRTWWKGQKGASPALTGMPPLLDALAKDCMQTRPGSRPGFTAIKQRLEAAANEHFENGDSLHAIDRNLSELQLASPAVGKAPNFSRLGVRQARAAVGNITRGSSALGRKLSRKDTERLPDPTRDYSELLSKPAATSEASQQDSSSKYKRSTSAMFGKKIKSLVRFPSSATK